MKKVTRILAVIAAALAVTAMPSAVYAFCTAGPQVISHQFDMYFDNCPDANPVAGYIYVLGADATINSLGTDFVCRDGTAVTAQGVSCQPGAGIAGDGIVTVQYDWGNPTGAPTGTLCPNPGGVAGVGRLAFQVVANNGASVVASLGFAEAFGGYIVEEIHPGGGFTPISCSAGDGMQLVSNTPGLQANTVCVNQTTPTFWNDCDPDSGGAGLGTCTEGTAPTIAPGQLYTRTGACNSIPDARKTAWTLLTSTAGPGGSKCVQITRPADNTCAFVGGTSIIAGAETSAMTSSMRIGGAAAQSDKVAIKKAELLQGKLKVDFGTENEATIVGFNVYGGATKLNSGLISAKGIGSNDYSFETGRGALKNERSITVEAVKSDGTSVKSASVTVK
jgi:hypothetical protein